MKAIVEKYKIYGFKKFFQYAFSELFHKVWMEFLRKSYSQKGEDIVIDRLLGSRRYGFYVDIGANDPDRFSNTKRFYDKGWSGINIEPDVNNFAKISAKRSRDINLNIGIGDAKGKMTFYKFIPDTLSTFSKEEADEYLEQGYKLLNSEDVVVERLSDILDKYAFGRKVDFMSMDTEGFDMQVLKSNDWKKFSPALICIESVAHTMSGANNEKGDNHETYLKNNGYEKVFDNGLNSIYKNAK